MTFRPIPAEREGPRENPPLMEGRPEEQRKESDSEGEGVGKSVKQKDGTMAPQSLEIHEQHDHAEVQAEDELVEEGDSG